MESKKKNIIILVFLVLVLIALNYNFLDSSLENFFLGGQSEKVHVERVIDGDTIVTEIGNVRFLGINTPERGELGFQEAKEFLEDLILNETIILEYVGEREDKYGRILAYVFYKNENVNTKLVEKGFGNYYFYDGKDIYSDDLEEAWEKCLANEINLCRPSDSPCSECLYINSEASSIVNDCSFSCDINGWIVKEEGRDKFVFSGILESGGKKEFELDVDNSQGTIFLWDQENRLVSWKKES